MIADEVFFLISLWRKLGLRAFRGRIASAADIYAKAVLEDFLPGCRQYESRLV